MAFGGLPHGFWLSFTVSASPAAYGGAMSGWETYISELNNSEGSEGCYKGRFGVEEHRNHLEVMPFTHENASARRT